MKHWEEMHLGVVCSLINILFTPFSNVPLSYPLKTSEKWRLKMG